MQTKESTGSGEVDAYRIEAKSTHGVACVGGIPYQEKWQEISLARGSGIPGDLWSRYTNLADCLTHDQAWALAWSFKAQAEAEGRYSIKVRVVGYKVKWSWSCEADGTAAELPHKHEKPELFKDTGELQTSDPDSHLTDPMEYLAAKQKRVKDAGSWTAQDLKDFEG